MKRSKRFDYLQDLVTEFQETFDIENKRQVLANLANFSYDPLNYQHLFKLNVIDLFLDTIAEGNDDLTFFAITGLCNLCHGDSNRDSMISEGGLNLIVSCLSSTNEGTVRNALTLLYYLILDKVSFEKRLRKALIEFSNKVFGCNNTCLSNIAHLLLEELNKDEEVTK